MIFLGGWFPWEHDLRNLAQIPDLESSPFIRQYYFGRHPQRRALLGYPDLCQHAPYQVSAVDLGLENLELICSIGNFDVRRSTLIYIGILWFFATDFFMFKAALVTPAWL